MPDFRKVQPGEPVTLGAREWNAIVDAAQAERARQYSLTSETSPDPQERTVVRLQNATGQALARHSVVGIGGPMFLPSSSLDAFLGDVVLRGVVPSSTTKHNFAVLLEPIPAGEIGRAVVGGIAACKVNMVDAAHVSAEAVAGDTTKLQSVGGAGKPQNVLWAEAGTGTRWALVRQDVGDCGCAEEEEEGEVAEPNCGCLSSPTTIYFYNASGVVGATDGSVPRTLTFTHGPFPAGSIYQNLSASNNGWLSDETWSTVVGTQPVSGRWVIWCSSVSLSYRFGRGTEVYGGGGQTGVQAFYAWATGGSGNTCEPFYMLQYTNLIGPGGGYGVALSAIAGDWGNGQVHVEVLAYHAVAGVRCAGATVTCAGVTAVTDGDGQASFFIPQATTARGWTCAKDGYVTATGSIPGAALQPDRAQGEQIVANMGPL